MTICMTITALKLLLSILHTEYETPALGEPVTSRRVDVGYCVEAGHTTSERARSAVFVYRIGPVIVGYPEDSWL
jgi:hypothetical protein